MQKRLGSPGQLSKKDLDKAMSALALVVLDATGDVVLTREEYEAARDAVLNIIGRIAHAKATIEPNEAVDEASEGRDDVGESGEHGDVGRADVVSRDLKRQRNR